MTRVGSGGGAFGEGTGRAASRLPIEAPISEVGPGIGQFWHAGRVTEQPWHDPYRSAPTPPPGYPQPGYPSGGYPYSYPQYPGAGGYYDPAAPYGRHPVTGRPYSDKFKTVAGLLQLLLSLVGFGGIGRFYIGDVGMGVAQLLVGWFTCGIGLIWSIIDAILILSDQVSDPQGRPLRDGT